ncbi:MAG: 23S rRNA (pseudouridine(1915)-N(3))-methyltransferase RlmH [Rhodospirillaceae bacterium]|nr:23S rRNA (pseudouridine(1915)-N(3))-methyltransferase RlmH [Rhodospirillaceae bacterium]|tara:strand:+ start:347 stop:808 length:462 start_codon:yes stop_codon:yes gene_type:complete
MRIIIAAVGKFRKGPERDLFYTYLKRLDWQIDLKEIEVKGRATGPERQKQEGELLQRVIPNGAIVIALDERGVAQSSKKLARTLANWQNQGQSTFVFLIGGADGLGERVRKRADLLLSFGTVTWPHMLVRAMLVEQIYRVRSILSGHPYHRNG